MPHKRKLDKTLWKVTLKVVAQDGRSLELVFLAIGINGDDAINHVRRDYKNTLKLFDIEMEIYEPVIFNSYFLEWSEKN